MLLQVLGLHVFQSRSSNICRNILHKFREPPCWCFINGHQQWRPENSVNNWNLLWLSRPLIIGTDQANIEISTFPNTITSKKAKTPEKSIYFFNKPVHSFMLHVITARTLKFQMSQFR